jgi:hypothetical protein
VPWNKGTMPIRPIAALARAVRRLAIVGAAAAVAIAIALFEDGFDAVDLLVVGLAAVPPVLLYLLAEALRALAELPDKLRSAPREAQSHAAALSGLAGEARNARLLRLPLVVWRAARVAGDARELIAPYAPALPLASPAFLGAAALAALAVPVEVVVALVLLAG